MKVSELIVILQSCDDDLEVRIADHFEQYGRPVVLEKDDISISKNGFLKIGDDDHRDGEEYA